MSDREPVPPRPDLPYGLAPVPRMPAQARPRATWRWWEALLVYVLIWVVSLIATAPLFAVIHSRRLSDLAVSAAVALINVGLLVLWLRTFHPTWRSVIGFPRNVWAEVRAGIAFGAMLYPGIVFGVAIIVNLVLQLVSGHDVHAPQQLPSHLSAAGVLLSIAYAVVIAPVHEELFFRGILFRSLADRHGFAIGAVGSGLAFGLIHYLPGPWYDSVLLMGVMVVTGFALAWFYERRGNIVASMMAHAMFNVIGLTLILVVR